MINTGVVGQADFADDAERARLGLNTLELDSVIDFIDLDTVEHAEEIVMPPRATVLAVGRKLQPDFFLLCDDLFDLTVFDLLELGRRDLAFFMLQTRCLQRRAPEETAHMVGAERRFLLGHRLVTPLTSEPA